jgi:hypothetical protein
MSGGTGLRVVIIGRGARDASDKGWGLGQDAKVVEMALRGTHAGGHCRVASIDHLDATSFCGSGRRPRVVDIHIHLEVPCRAAWKWARYNIVMVNQEWWYREAWSWVLATPDRGGADLFLFKSAYARSLFPMIESRRARVLPWRCTPEINAVLDTLGAAGGDVAPRREFLYLVGASVNKSTAARAFVEAWRPSWPPLRIVGVPTVLDGLRRLRPDAAAAGIVFQPPFDTDSERIAAQRRAAFHVVASSAEGFGFTFAEAAAVGAIPVWTDIPVYNELYGSVLGSVGKVVFDPAKAEEAGVFMDINRGSWSADAVSAAVESVLSLPSAEAAALQGQLRHVYTTRIKDHRHTWRAVLGAIETRLRSAPALILPPRPLPAADLPHVGIVTLTHNRPRWWTNMARNILLADYPRDKMTWVIVDDSTGEGRVDEQVLRFRTAHPGLKVEYLSLPRVTPIGEKRNRGCEAALDASIFVMMDDDDHYPKSSILARVTWMRAFNVPCVYCATLPMYDCKNYISAINVPPLDLSPAERVSEASLAFTRDFWVARKFPAGVSVAEGMRFLSDRIESTAEIPPEGVIVSFLHGLNFTSRRVPDATEPNGCHYGFEDEYFTYLSGLAV